MMANTPVAPHERLRRELLKLAAGLPTGSVRYEDWKEHEGFLFVIDVSDRPSLEVQAYPGMFHFYCGQANFCDYPLRESADANWVLALCDAFIAGRAIHLTSPKSRLARSWFILRSRGERMTVRSSCYSCFSKAQAPKRGKWLRQQPGPLPSEADKPQPKEVQ